jgi:hypothetical protein
MRRLFGHMVTTDPASTMWEAVDPDGDPSGRIPGTNGGVASLSHGWSTGSVSALNSYVLGIQPATPGFATWRVVPQPLDVRWAQGQTLTPRGPLIARWTIGDPDRDRDDDSLKLTVIAPPRTRGSIVVPTLGRARTIAMDGRVAWRPGRAARGIRAAAVSGGVRFDAVAGSHTFAWTAS